MSIQLSSIRKIHSLKQLLATQAEWELAEAIRNQDAASMVLQQMQTRLDQTLADFTNKQKRGLTALDLMDGSAWIERQRADIAAQLEHLQKAMLEVDRIRQKLIDSYQTKEVWKRFRDQRQIEFDRELLKLNQAELDEIGSRNRYKQIAQQSAD